MGSKFFLRPFFAVFVAISISTLVVFNNCSKSSHEAVTKESGTGTGVGNPFSSAYTDRLINTICSVMNKCHSDLSQAACTQGLRDAPGFAAALSLPTQKYSTLNTVATAEMDSRIQVDANLYASCLQSIKSLSCDQPGVGVSYISNQTNPFSRSSEILSSIQSQCQNSLRNLDNFFFRTEKDNNGVEKIISLYKEDPSGALPIRVNFAATDLIGVGEHPIFCTGTKQSRNFSFLTKPGSYVVKTFLLDSSALNFAAASAPQYSNLPGGQRDCIVSSDGNYIYFVENNRVITYAIDSATGALTGIGTDSYAFASDQYDYRYGILNPIGNWLMIVNSQGSNFVSFQIPVPGMPVWKYTSDPASPPGTYKDGIYDPFNGNFVFNGKYFILSTSGSLTEQNDVIPGSSGSYYGQSFGIKGAYLSALSSSSSKYSFSLWNRIAEMAFSPPLIINDIMSDARYSHVTSDGKWGYVSGDSGLSYISLDNGSASLIPVTTALPGSTNGFIDFQVVNNANN